ncbi:MAG: aldehyde ferredoxin oxidoreductase family protein [Candidatus Njordarchaeales archaeon]
MYGYHGKILIINLSKKNLEILELKENMLKNFIGGAGLGAYLFLKYTRGQKVAPFSEENPLIFMTGPLTGTLAPASGRHAVISLSPLTGILGEATSGGFFGAELRRTGYDGLMFVGKSEKPVYILIDGEDVIFEDGEELWGLGVYETMKIIKKNHGKEFRIACIGPAGENLVKYAAIINDDGRAAGRTGLGAVMGWKNLKAIAVRGEKSIQVYSSEFYEYARNLFKEIADSLVSRTLRELGTASYFEVGYELGDIPGKYFTSLDFDPESLSGSKLNELFQVRPKACFACPIGCGREIRLGEKIVHGPEYETLAALGSLNLVMDIEKIVLANHLCNDLGLDTISTGVSISFLNYLIEKGVFNREKIRISWGDGDGLIEVIKKIAYREDIGDLLAEGVKNIAEKLGINANEAAHVKGLEIPMHDPRAFFSMALVYMTGNRGACHLRGDAYTVDMGVLEDEYFNLTLGEQQNLIERVPSIIGIQNLREVFNSLILCIFTNLTSKEISKLLSLATGWDFSPEKLYNIGERIYNLKRGINNLYGISRKDDSLPEIVLKPYEKGAIAGQSPKDQLETALMEYYKLRGWDWDTGKPKKEVLEKLGLRDLAELLWEGA